jgi:hypothetical protein
MGSMRVGIVGFVGGGKSTLFEHLPETRPEAELLEAVWLLRRNYEAAVTPRRDDA